MEKSDIILVNQTTAYAGALGKLRRQFCIDYSNHKRVAIALLEAELKHQTDAVGVNISCAPCCSRCCYLFISATIPECEAIVCHLYQHQDALELFLSGFLRWRQAAAGIGDTVYTISRLQEKILCNQVSANEMRIFSEALTTYEELDIACPFLTGSLCSIHHLRPYVCARLASTSPTAWCDRSNPNHRNAKLQKAELKLSKDPPYFANPNAGVAVSCMPTLVYEILTRGWQFLCSVPWFSGLKEQITTDSELMTALIDGGVMF